MFINLVRSMFSISWICNFAIVSILALPGCATTPYRLGSAASYHTSPELAARTQTQIERGRPNVVIDSLGWVWGIPAKLTLFNRRVENHRIDEHTEAEIAAYLHDNELSTVKVRLHSALVAPSADQTGSPQVIQQRQQAADNGRNIRQCGSVQNTIDANSFICINDPGFYAETLCS